MVDGETELRSRIGSDNARSVKSTQDEGKRPCAGTISKCGRRSHGLRFPLTEIALSDVAKERS
jgi:hypothetical protein